MKTWGGGAAEIGQWLAKLPDTPRPLYPRQRDGVPIVQEGGCVPELLWTLWRREYFLLPSGINPMIFQLIALSLY